MAKHFPAQQEADARAWLNRPARGRRDSRRVWLAVLGLLGGLMAADALAQTPPPARPAQPVRRSRPLEATMVTPHGESWLLTPRAQATTTEPRRQDEAAPVPNRNIEAPLQGFSMEPKVTPEVFRSRMPGRSANIDGATNQQEQRAYAPAPGARLIVPFFTR